jgi:hypothetical protein
MVCRRPPLQQNKEREEYAQSANGNGETSTPSARLLVHTHNIVMVQKLFKAAQPKRLLVLS